MSLSPASVTERDSRTVFVWQLAARITGQDLKDFFSTIGRIRDVRLIVDQRTRKSKGIAYVEFAQPSSVDLAVKLTGTRVLGVPIQVQRSQSDKNKAAAQTSNVSTVTGQTRANSMKLYVGSLDYNITEEMVRPIFEAYGVVEEFKLIKEAGTTRSQGYGFLTFQRSDDARKAMQELNGFLIAGRPMKVGTVTDRSGELKTGTTLDTEDLERSGLDLTTSGRIALMAKLAEGTGLEIPRAAQSALQHYQQQHSGGVGSGHPFKPVLPPGPSSIDDDQLTRSPPLPFREELPTPCLILRNVFDAHKDANLLFEIEEDILSECTRLGGIVHMKMDTRSVDGCVYVKCINVEVAKKCVNTLNGRYFSGRQIHAELIPLLQYIKLFPDAISLRIPLKPS